MREILFRGKRKDNGEWVEGYLVYSQHRKAYYILENITSFPIEVIPETIGQYTGLELKGVKVFDGDIVSLFPTKRKMYVLWNEETFAWELADIGTQPNEINHLINCISLGELGVEACFENEIRSEVVGNIYDNPEMMEANDAERSNQTF